MQNPSLQALAEALLQGQGNTQRGALRQPQRSPTFSLRCSQKHPTGMFLMGSPCAPPGTGPAGFSAPNGCPPFVTKRPAAPRPGCRPRHGAEGFLLSFCIAKRKKQRKGSLRKGVSLPAGSDRGAAPGPCRPLKRAALNFTGLRPCWLRLQAAAFALRRVKAP